MCFSIACCCSCHLDSQSSRCQWLHFCLCPMIPCQRAVQLTKFSPAALWRQHPWHSFCSTWQFRQVMGCFSRARSVLPWHLLNMNDDTNSALKASVDYPPLRPRSVQKYSWHTKGHFLEEAWQEWLYFTHLEQTVYQAILSVYLQIHLSRGSGSVWLREVRKIIHGIQFQPWSGMFWSQVFKVSKLLDIEPENAQDYTEDAQLGHTVWGMLAALRLQLCRPWCCAIIRNLEV